MIGGLLWVLACVVVAGVLTLRAANRDDGEEGESDLYDIDAYGWMIGEEDLRV